MQSRVYDLRYFGKTNRRIIVGNQIVETKNNAYVTKLNPYDSEQMSIDIGFSIMNMFIKEDRHKFNFTGVEFIKLNHRKVKNSACTYIGNNPYNIPYKTCDCELDYNAYLPLWKYNGRCNLAMFDPKVKDIVRRYTKLMKSFNYRNTDSRELMTDDISMRVIVTMIFGISILTNEEQIMWSNWLRELYEVRRKAELKAYAEFCLPF